jgi:hypothetical protein
MPAKSTKPPRSKKAPKRTPRAKKAGRTATLTRGGPQGQPAYFYTRSNRGNYDPNVRLTRGDLTKVMSGMMRQTDPELMNRMRMIENMIRQNEAFNPKMRPQPMDVDPPAPVAPEVSMEDPPATRSTPRQNPMGNSTETQTMRASWDALTQTPKTTYRTHGSQARPRTRDAETNTAMFNQSGDRFRGTKRAILPPLAELGPSKRAKRGN